MKSINTMTKPWVNINASPSYTLGGSVKHKAIFVQPIDMNEMDTVKIVKKLDSIRSEPSKKCKNSKAARSHLKKNDT